MASVRADHIPGDYGLATQDYLGVRRVADVFDIAGILVLRRRHGAGADGPATLGGPNAFAANLR